MLPFFYIKRIISERALEEDVMKIDTEQVIATYKDRIFAIGLTMLKNPDDAEDVVQDIIHIKKILNLKNIFNLGYIK